MFIGLEKLLSGGQLARESDATTRRVSEGYFYDDDMRHGCGRQFCACEGEWRHDL